MHGRSRGDQRTDRWSRTDWWGVVLDTPDPGRLARFYAELLDWKLATETEGWVTIGPDEGVAYLGFQLAPDFVPPVWPNVPGAQQLGMHLDFEVDDLTLAVASAEEMGAVEHPHQPQSTVRVMIDPDGHLFCLYT
ncbi:VOC family protein [Nocardioides mangrovi]|uniref:VOC family protein n=1 Tax=Nocardioides mangrovi TaxID=2874580 RepID=A0ABS7UFL8_9ACTN|nr:VOC family protein [Nocardioides mangrovi]MBZ5739577.1 VOC family protein [Nocardioides mangrovi]